MIQVEPLAAALSRTFETLVEGCIWDICMETLYVDYVVYREGASDYLAVGWQWDDPKSPSLTHCVKITGDKITDYYHSYEKFSTHETGVFSHEVDPTTLEKICEYRVTEDGVHKYDLAGEIIQRNDPLTGYDLTSKDILSNTDIPFKSEALLVSKKPYGNIVYLDAKRDSASTVARLIRGVA